MAPQRSTGEDVLARKYPLVVPVQVRFRDLDALGHVNNAVYLSYLEMARVAYVQSRFGLAHPRDFSFILARVEIDYKSPVTLGERLVVGIGVAHVGQRSFRFAYEIREAATGRLVAQAETVQVMYDYEAQQVVPIPEAIRRQLEADRVFDEGGGRV